MANKARASFKLFDRTGKPVGLASFAGKSFKKAQALGARMLSQVGIRKANPAGFILKGKTRGFRKPVYYTGGSGIGFTSPKQSDAAVYSLDNAKLRADIGNREAVKTGVRWKVVRATNPQAKSYLRAWKKAALAGDKKKSLKLMGKYVKRKVRDAGKKSLYTIRTGNAKTSRAARKKRKLYAVMYQGQVLSKHHTRGGAESAAAKVSPSIARYVGVEYLGPWKHGRKY